MRVSLRFIAILTADLKEESYRQGRKVMKRSLSFTTFNPNEIHASQFVKRDAWFKIVDVALSAGKRNRANRSTYFALVVALRDAPHFWLEFIFLKVGSHQFKVTPGDMIYTEKLKRADINEKVYLLNVPIAPTLAFNLEQG